MSDWINNRFLVFSFRSRASSRDAC